MATTTREQAEFYLALMIETYGADHWEVRRFRALMQS